MRDTVSAVLEAVGPGFVVGYRLSGDEFLPDGITLEDTLAAASALEGGHRLHPRLGGQLRNGVDGGGADVGRPRHLEHLAAAMKDHVSVPVLSVGRYHQPDLAKRVLADGHADFTRALLADPDLPRKAQQGREEEIRPCIACEQGGIDRWFGGLDITCIGNRETGRELLPGWQAPQPAGEPHEVLVIGGGPAGLEAARVVALRGHTVTLWERRPTSAVRWRSPPAPPRREHGWSWSSG